MGRLSQEDNDIPSGTGEICVQSVALRSGRITDYGAVADLQAPKQVGAMKEGRSHETAGKTLCIQWSTFGPYHAARLQALEALASEKKLRVVGLETAARDTTYGFTLDSDSRESVSTVFEGAVFEDLEPRAIDRAIRAALDRLDPIAVGITSYSYPDARACLAWCKERGRVAVLMTDSKADAGKRRRWREWVKKHIVRGFEAALVAGTAHRQYLIQLGFDEAAIFDGYNVVDNHHFSEGAEKAREDRGHFAHLPGLGSETPYFIASGRMTETKNYPGLLEAYQRYRAISQDPWRLVVIGDGPMRNTLEDLIADAGISGVALAGRRSYAELPAYYGLAGALVHTAFVDTWGLVVNEAMASRLPILCSTGTGCWQDLVAEGENGFVFNPVDAETLATLMHRLSSDPGLCARMGDRSAQIIQNWAPDRFATGFLKAYEYAMAKDIIPPSTLLRMVLKSLTWTAKSPTSFHSIKP